MTAAPPTVLADTPTETLEDVRLETAFLDAAAETSDPDVKRALIALCRREHRYGMELARRADATARRGQMLGFASVTFVLVLAGYVASLGEAEWAAGIAGIDVVGLASVFVTGRWLAYRSQA
ncbi:hypothetical protein AB0M36_09515 [Actinoplanes sp. NPDC051346]|uniref:hypothetical protein n=1 Tax=Actinoplanes sp. NPDC051346 TaxID=3155048 RepID=UPI003431F5B4